MTCIIRLHTIFRIAAVVGICILSAPVKAWQLPRVSFDGGVLKIQTGSVETFPVPPKGTTIDDSVLACIQVRDTGNAKKGFGGFCVRQNIPKHTFLGFYPGKKVVRDLNQLEAPIVTDNAGEYLVSLDGGMTFLDGYERGQDRSVFAPVHLNHKDVDEEGCNCLRQLAGGEVAFFTKREIHVGEELCFDYGENYWRGREGDKV